MGFCPARSTQIMASMTSWPSIFALLFDLDRDAIRQLFHEFHGELLADGLGDLELVAAVGALLGREQLRRHGQARGDDVDEPVEIDALLRRHRHHVEETVHAGELRHERQQLILRVNHVDLVDDGDGFAARLADALQDRLVFLAEAQRFDDEHHEIRIGERRRGRAIHGAIERALFAEMQARRVDESDLHARPIEHAEHAMARGLRARRDDGKFFADQRVEQRRLADVRPADERGETRAECDGVSPFACGAFFSHVNPARVMPPGRQAARRGAGSALRLRSRERHARRRKTRGRSAHAARRWCA